MQTKYAVSVEDLKGGVNVYNYGEYMKIDKEFQSLIFPLSNDEYILLEQNIIRDGCRDALVVWKEEDILLDGHNRYKICQKHKIDYKIKIISLSDRTAAEDWIDSNQLGRRNLSPDMMRLIRGRLYNRLKEAKGGDIRTKIPKGQNEPLALSHKTAIKIAKQQGVSPMTVRRDGEFAKQVEAKPELMKAIKERVPVKKVIKEMHKENSIPSVISAVVQWRNFLHQELNLIVLLPIRHIRRNSFISMRNLQNYRSQFLL